MKYKCNLRVTRSNALGYLYGTPPKAQETYPKELPLQGCEAFHWVNKQKSARASYVFYILY